MDSGLPDVFDVFGLGTCWTPNNTPRGGIPLPGLVREENSKQDKEDIWAPRQNRQDSKWRQDRSTCERPRTYDKFYQKTPGNFVEPQTDSAVSLCSSENDEHREPLEKGRRKRRGRKTCDKDIVRENSKTLTEQDIKHIERHLSMKRTIRKKIMRDLKHTFVKDPTGEEKAKENLINVYGQSEPNILDMLRDSQDSGNVSPVEQKFRSCRIRRRKSSYIDSSTEELNSIFGNGDKASLQSSGLSRIDKLRDIEPLPEPPPDYDFDKDYHDCSSEKHQKEGKRSFLQRLISWRTEKRKL